MLEADAGAVARVLVGRFSVSASTGTPFLRAQTSRRRDEMISPSFFFMK